MNRKMSTISGKSRKGDSSAVKKNDHGGVLVTTEELRAAFDFLDADQTGKVSLGNLKSRLGVFFPEYTSKDYRLLMNNKKDLTYDDLCDLLLENEIHNFDPIAEAFKSYDPNDEGEISAGRLKEVFKQVGLGDLTGDEVSLLMRAADTDGDGKVSLDDFRCMVELGKAPPAHAPIHGHHRPITHTTNNKRGGAARGGSTNQER
mmetsp:Transcript_8651/g.8789  ORF Transcript_8651/g.8789 Transcript_8651/m.8789 type:complete len:203 (+) Transcript_8651:171-779(+)|eukprot:CAMPEP_0182417930 /NCGR_PEP_ID=MMETSP1167-20130531/2392_1 /TAXON_ID=2988 /ORGANISM="Mallomonas Sp, Strain CCMP3275" /LENGTH=202 /DNA_ID=CAMNT_0024591825 /DNA_START=111 /DNA_END=719 /DNA_ORIENTATION=+